MWNFLKADLQELVAVVKEDAASLGIPVVEGHVDNDNPNRNESQYADVGTKPYSVADIKNTQKSPAQEEAEHRMNIAETFTVPLLPRKVTNNTNMNAADDKKGELHKEDLDSEPKIDESPLSASNIVSESTNEDTGNEGDAGEDVNDGNVAVDDDDVDVEADEYEVQQIQEYLNAFNINDEQTQQEIADLLEEYKDTLRIQYDTLVPNHVTHEEFWERYFYRCDVTRIEMEWDREDEQQEQYTRAKARSGTKIVNSVTSFFGDAARAVATGMSNALTEDLEPYNENDDYDDDDDPATDKREISSTARGLATSLFGQPSSAHRPPFVMNTAVDEDDGEEEEEEIGWDDDDEEEDEEQIVFDDNTGGPVMSFKLHRSAISSDSQEDHSAVLLCEQLKEQLKQAMEERDILHQTVSLQTKEIATLKSAVTPVSEQNEGVISDASTNIIPQDPSSVNNHDSNAQNLLQAKVQVLNTVISELENQILEMKSRYEGEIQVLQERVHELQIRNDHVQLQMQELERTTSFERNDMNETLDRLEAEKVELQVQLQTAQSDVAASQTKIINLQMELDTTQDQLKMAYEKNTGVSFPVTTEDNIVTDATTNMSSSGELTTATGVKVTLPSPPPPSTVVSKITNNNDDEEEEEEGWGDDWD
jgi:BSD domain